MFGFSRAAPQPLLQSTGAFEENVSSFPGLLMSSGDDIAQSAFSPGFTLCNFFKSYQKAEVFKRPPKNLLDLQYAHPIQRTPRAVQDEVTESFKICLQFSALTIKVTTYPKSFLKLSKNNFLCHRKGYKILICCQGFI